MSCTPSPVPRRSALVRGSLLGLVLGVASAEVAAQDEGSGPRDEAPPGVPAGSGGAAGRADDPSSSPAVVEARAALRAGSLEDGVLSVHAVALVDAGDLATLREVLAGSRRNAVLGVLSALKVRFADELLDSVTDLAARTGDGEVRARALEALREVVRARPAVLARLDARLDDAALAVDVRRAVVGLLGASHDLRAVPALLDELRGPAAEQADAALSELSRHERPPGPDAARWWSAFWERNAGVTREELIERELLRQRDAHAEEMARKNDEIVKTRIASMGNDVDRLMAEVTDEFQRVRLAAVRSLGQHPNKEQAANAVPLLLACLGYRGASTENASGAATPANGTANGGSANGNGNGNGHAPEVPRETDDEVRTAIVTALGTLGRGRADVQEVLLDVVRNSEGPIASAAVDALAGERDQPQVVPPLLQFIGRSEVPSATLVNVLRIIAQNQPREVFAELAPWMSPSFGEDVRAAAVEAVVADVDLGPALASVTALTSADQPAPVRFALARALGKRLRAPVPPAEDVRPRILGLLDDLADDIDKSVRAEAATSLGELRSTDALRVLEERALRETDPSVVEKLLAALGMLGRDECVPIIGRTCGSWVGGEPERLLAAAQVALAAIGAERDAAAWLDMATRLREAGSPALSVWACREVERRFSGSQPARELVQRARGALVEGLFLEGRAQEAHDLLVELHDSKAPYPNATRRLELLAGTSEALELWGEAAEHYAQLLELQGEGEANRLPTRRAYAVALMEAGRSEDALTMIVALFAEDAGDDDLLLRQALLLERLGRLAEAEDVLLRLDERLPPDDAASRASVASALERVQAALGTVRGGPPARPSTDEDGDADGTNETSGDAGSPGEGNR